MTLKNKRTPFLCCLELCASFHNHQWILTGVTVRKRSIRVKIVDFLSRVTLKFHRWPWKRTRYLFYVAWSFVHHFIAISKIKQELQSRNDQFGSKSMFSFSVVLPWNLTDDLENRAPLLCYFKLCASFRSHWWIQTGVTVRKRPNLGQNRRFFSRVTLKFDGWP